MYLFKNLAPGLVRQRLTIEGTTEIMIPPEQITQYLNELAKVTGMEKLAEPVVYSAHELGWGAWIHWRTSGAMFYSYPTNPPLFSVDCYTCKPFSPLLAVEFTKKFFSPLELVWTELLV